MSRVTTVATRFEGPAVAAGSAGFEGVQHVEASPFMRKVKRLTYQPPVR